MGSGASGTMPGHEDKMPFGNRPNGIYIPRFRNVKSKHKDFLRGYGYQGGGSRDGWSRGMWMTGLGAEFKNALKMPGPWRMGMGGFGECLPNHGNYVEIDEDKQRAVSQALTAPDILLVEGPPGTGKTYRGARLVRALLQAGLRVGIRILARRRRSQRHTRAARLVVEIKIMRTVVVGARHDDPVAVRSPRRRYE